MKYLVMIQARCGSSRLPGKVLKDLCGEPVLQQMIRRVQRSRLVDDIMVVTTDNEKDQEIVNLCNRIGIRVGTGSEEDVLDRFYQNARPLHPEYVIRLTGDCPCMDPQLIDQAILQMEKDADYCGMLSETFADGLDIEIVKFSALEKSWKEAVHTYEREHVTQYIIRHPQLFRLQDFVSLSGYFGDQRWTVDEEEDFELVSSIFSHFLEELGWQEFGYQDILAYLAEHPGLMELNKMYRRNEGLEKSMKEEFLQKDLVYQSKSGKGQALYERAKKIIPGGTQLLSKRPEMFLPDYWPAYYSRAKGCSVWDMDGRKYTDMSYMGIGANVLGYAQDEVDAAAEEAVRCGGMCTLNAPEEVYLAEELLRLHPWAGGVRYAKAGGEAMAMAARIARAYTKKEQILFCGYHGWHDWYLAANLSDKEALNDQHIAGLEPLGVPGGLAGTSLPFHYNCYEEFEALLNQYQGSVAAVIMEPVRNDVPKDDFLKKIRKAAHDQGIVLIFDEITAGFRLCAGGSHKVLGVEPDIAVFAKGMTNGYPLSAVLGRREVMEAAQDTFISSTFYTERIALAAALKSIELYQKYRVWEKQTAYGEMVRNGWQQKAEKNGICIKTGGIAPLSHFTVEGKEDALVYKTFFTQEMLKRGYLASTAFYASYAHSEEIIKEYLAHTDEVFATMARIQESGNRLESFLDGPVCHAGFGRLN